MVDFFVLFSFDYFEKKVAHDAADGSSGEDEGVCSLLHIPVFGEIGNDRAVATSFKASGKEYEAI